MMRQATIPQLPSALRQYTKAHAVPFGGTNSSHGSAEELLLFI
jgi:hypothetical protein